MTATVTETGHALWFAHQDFIQKTARSIAYSYVKVEAEDVAQEIWAFLWQKESAFLEHNRSEAYVKTCIRNVAKNYAMKQRDTTLLETDTFYYSVDEVKELLPTFFSLKEDWNGTATADNGVNVYDSRDSLAIFTDFSLAYDRLSVAQRAILVRRYADDEELSEAKDRQQASRAVKRMWHALNVTTDKKAKDHTGPGSRTVITNYKAANKVRAAYEDVTK